MKQFCKKFLEFCQTNIIAKQCNLEDTFEIVNDPKSKNVKLQLKNHKGSISSTQMNPAVQLDIKLGIAFFYYRKSLFIGSGTIKISKLEYYYY